MPPAKKKTSARRRRPPTRVKAPPILFKKTQTVLDRIQRKVDGTFLSYWTSTSGSVCDNDVLALHEDSGGALWIGTNGGLSRLSGGRISNVSSPEGMLERGIFSIFEDDVGDLWLCLRRVCPRQPE